MIRWGGVLVGLFGQLLVSETLPQRDSTSMLMVCRSFVRLRWKVDDNHLQATCNPEKWNPSKKYPEDPGFYKSQFEPGVPQRGEAYSYGGALDPGQFDQSLAPGRHLWEWPKCPAQGIDCSAFVSKAWGLERVTTESIVKFTHDLGLFKDQWTENNLQRGDALDAPGFHVILFDHYTPEGEMCIYEATPPRVVLRVLDRNALLIGNYVRHPVHILRYAGGFSPLKGPLEVCPDEQTRPGFVRSPDTSEEATVFTPYSNRISAKTADIKGSRSRLFELSTHLVRFMDQKVGTESSPQYATIKLDARDDLSNDALTIFGPDAPDFSVTPTATADTSDARHKVISLKCIFNPRTEGDKEAKISIRLAGASESANVTFIGHGTRSCLNVEPEQSDLGYQYLNSKAVATLLLRNCGTVPVGSIEIATVRPLRAGSTQVPDLPVGDTIVPVPLAVQFDTLGQYVGTIGVKTDGVVTGAWADPTDHLTFLVRAFVEEPTLTVENLPADGIKSEDFRPAQTRVLILRNSSHLPMRDVRASVSSSTNEFFGETSKTNLLEGLAPLPITVRFLPSASGSRQASVLMEWTLPDGRVRHSAAELTGTATSCLKLSVPSGLDFGRVRKAKIQKRRHPSRQVIFGNCGDVPIVVRPLMAGLAKDFVLLTQTEEIVVTRIEDASREPNPPLSFLEIGFSPLGSGQRKGDIEMVAAVDRVLGGEQCHKDSDHDRVCLSVTGTGEAGLRALLSCTFHHCE